MSDMMKEAGESKTRGFELAAIQEAFLSCPDEAVFLERALILRDSKERYRGLSPGLRQGKTIEDLCSGVSVVVEPFDVLLCRVREDVPSPEEERFIEGNPDLFVEPGAPGWLEATSIYIPDWEKLLRLGIGGLIAEAEERKRSAQTESGRDELEGVRLSLEAIGHLIGRYAREARRVAAEERNGARSGELRRAAESCEAVATGAPRSFREALQLFTIFHTALSCIIGGRDITPGRMDQYLLPFYERGVGRGAVTRSEAVELMAAMMMALPQLSGHVATDFQSAKRTPTRFSHYYITLGGIKPDGSSGVSDLSHAFLEARRLVNHREPTLVIRWFEGIEWGFWQSAAEVMRDGLPVFPYNDRVVIPALVRNGVPEELARGYAHSACMLCLTPGYGRPPMDDQHNCPEMVLLAMNGGRDLLTGEAAGAAGPEPGELADFDAFFEAVRAQMKHSLGRAVKRHQARAYRPTPYPLPARPLLRAGEVPQFAEERFIGFATTVDSLIAIKRLVYEEKRLSLEQLAGVLRDDFAGQEGLRQFVRSQLPAYGGDEPEVIALVARVGGAWVEEVLAAGESVEDVKLRPTFHSWLYNIEQGRRTPTTPDGRLRGEPLSIDFSPSRGRGRAYTESLRCAAQVPHEFTCSGGTPFRVSPTHFEGRAGVERLAALIEGYFAEGGLQVHFVMADAKVLRDAVARPEEYGDLLVRVTGFSEYFVRLLPEVQQEIIRRVE